MTAPPLLSIVMPSFNQAKYIGMAIDSVLSQRDGTIELLVMDGGSTDGTIDVLHRYRTQLRFISERDRGQADAINRGFERTRGDILGWLNSDDMFTPGALGRVIRVFRENPSVDFVYSRGWNTDEVGRIVDEAGVLPFDLWRLIHQRNFIQQPSCFFRRSLLEKVGPLDERLHYVMDWDLWIRFGAYRGLYVDDFWSYNRVHHHNKTQSGELRRWHEIQAMIRRYTTARRPPVVRLYLLEALIQLMRRRGLPSHLERPLVREFERGMRRSMSGRYADGSVRSRFSFSLGNAHRERNLTLTLSPLSRYHRDRLGADPLVVQWRSSAGARGTLALLENGFAQQFVIVPGDSAAPFTHITCWSDNPGLFLERSGASPPRRIIGFLDGLDADLPVRPSRGEPHRAAEGDTPAPSPASSLRASVPAAVSGRAHALRCWCGTTLGEPLGDHHRRCPACGSASRVRALDTEPPLEAAQGMWRHTWVGLPHEAAPSDSVARVFADIAERCLVELDHLLDFVAPPGRVLEIGCGHGAFVRLLGEAGFEATGTELRPGAADFARTTFGVRVELGSLETLALEPGFLAVCGSGLFEHAPDPVRVAHRAAGLLRADGVLRFEAIRYRGQGSEWDMLRERTHRALFTEAAMRQLLQGVGFREIAIDPSRHPDQMWVTATRGTLSRQRFHGPATRLPAWTGGLHALRAELARAEKDRVATEAARNVSLGHVETLIERLRAAEVDGAARLTQIETLTSWLQEAEADRAARLTQIETLRSWLQEAEADRAVRLTQIETLTEWLQQANIERDVLRHRLEVIQRTRAWRAYQFLTRRRHRDRW